MFGWAIKRRAEVIRQDEARIEQMKKERERQQAMEREKRDLFYGLGFDLGDDGQCWLRNAQLLAEYRNDIADLKARLSAIEGR